MADRHKENRSVPMDVDCPDVVVSNEAKLTETDGTNDSPVVGMPGDGSGEGGSLPTKSSTAHQRRMKKDDSGICVETAPDESSSDEEGPESEKVKTGKGRGLSKLDVKKTEGISDKSSPDSGHHESNFGPDFLDSDENNKDTEKSKTEVEDSDDVPIKVRRKKRIGVIDDETDDEILSAKSDNEKITSSEDEKEKPVVKSKPKHKWFLTPEVVQRQYGIASSYHSELFCLRAYGSLHMTQRLELMYKMKKHEGCVNSLHFNMTGTRLASGSDDLNVIVWDWTISEPVLTYDSGHRSNVFQAKFIPYSGDCHIVSCARDGQVRLAELSTTGVCKNTRKLAQHRGPAHKLALQFESPQSFLSCGEDAVVFEIDLRENKPKKLLTCKENERKLELYTIFVNPGNMNEFSIGGRDHFVRIYDKRKINQNGDPMKKFCPHQLLNSDIRANVTCLVYNYNGSEILCSYNDEDIYTFDSQHSDGADYVHKYQGHRNNATVKGVNYFGPKSEFIISGSDCGNIYFWEHDTEQVVNFFAGDEGGVVNCLEPHTHIPVLATSGLDDDIKIWVPSCEGPPTLAGLKSITRANLKDREEERRREPETIDGQMLWFLMHQLRRTARRRARQEGQQVEETSSDENSEDSDDSQEMPQSVQCAPS